MTLEELKQSGRIIYECLVGSHSYGTNDENSDIDLKGFFLAPQKEYLMALSSPEPQINDEKHNEVYYSLRRGFELLSKSNPNIIELLWMPDDCIRINSSKMEKIIANRDLFISKQAFFSHANYARSQIGKAKGQNKKVHNPMPEEMPVKEDFCWIIPKDDMLNMDCGSDILGNEVFPMRPFPFEDWADLSDYHVSAVEHTSNVYRLYDYGDKAKGVFRGDDMLVCESIPKEDENSRFAGLLIYNQDSYNKALKDWHSYWDWKRNRNESRWVDQEKGILTYDSKNMLHCMRLLFAAEEILLTGNPLVRFEDERLDYLMKIRNAELTYEEIMEEVDKRMKLMEYLYEKSTLPDDVDKEKIEKLYREVTKENCG